MAHAYQMIAGEIRQKIKSREIEPGEAIPSLPAIQQAYGVSYTTAQSAVALLKAWGLVEARQGAGTYVRPASPVVELMSCVLVAAAGAHTWREVASRFGMVGDQRIVGAGVEPPPGDIADAFGYDAETPVAWRCRVILADDYPIQLVTSYYATEVAAALPELARPARLRVWAPELMAEAGFEVTGGRDTAIGRAATEEEAAGLGLDVGAPVSEVLRVAKCAGSVVMVERMVSDSARIRQTWDF